MRNFHSVALKRTRLPEAGRSKMKKHLAVEVSNDLISFTELLGETVIRQDKSDLPGRTAQEKKEAVQKAYEALSLGSKDFDAYTLAYFTHRSTIVPNDVFNASDPAKIFQLCFGEPKTDASIDYNRISEHGMINVYEIPDWIKSFFVLRHPQIIMQHAGSHAIRQVLDRNAFKLKVNVGLFHDKFQLLMAKHNKLEFYSFFDHQNVEDVIYHLSFALQQKELFGEQGTVEINTAFGEEKELLDRFVKELSSIAELKKLSPEISGEYFAKSQLLCV